MWLFGDPFAGVHTNFVAAYSIVNVHHFLSAGLILLKADVSMRELATFGGFLLVVYFGLEMQF